MLLLNFVSDKSVQSVISFDQGGEWVPLRKPADSKCDATAKDTEKVKKKKSEESRQEAWTLILFKLLE